MCRRTAATSTLWYTAWPTAQRSPRPSWRLLARCVRCSLPVQPGVWRTAWRCARGGVKALIRSACVAAPHRCMLTQQLQRRRVCDGAHPELRSSLIMISHYVINSQSIINYLDHCMQGGSLSSLAFISSKQEAGLLKSHQHPFPAPGPGLTGSLRTSSADSSSTAGYKGMDAAARAMGHGRPHSCPGFRVRGLGFRV